MQLIVDLAEVRLGNESDKADCVIKMSDKDCVDIMGGKVNAQSAFMQGKLKVIVCQCAHSWITFFDFSSLTDFM